MAVLRIENLSAAAPDKEILAGVSLEIMPSEIHALMGPNGSGKSTLANALAGNPAYQITGGRIFLDDKDITRCSPNEVAAAGLFLGFQYPEEIPGVNVLNFLCQAMSVRKGIEDFSVLEARLAAMTWMERLGMDGAFLERYLNEGFSGGERKRNEILQMALLEPICAVLDETDSGLDIDALKIVADGISKIRSELPDMGLLLITHYQRLLDYIPPDHVHILIDGKIVQSGGPDLARSVETIGFESFRAAVT